MAKYTLTNSWFELPVMTGTIQNISTKNVPIEVSEEETNNTGQVLYPKDAMSFSGVQLYARTTLVGAVAEGRISPFADAVGGGGSSTYVLPTATVTKLGGVKVGKNVYTNSSGVLSAYLEDWVTATSYVVDDVVVKDGVIYRCITANSDVAFTEANWEKLGGSGGGISTWETGKGYKAGDVVIQGTNIYQCITNHTSGGFSDDKPYWQILGDCLWSYNGDDVIPTGNGYGSDLSSGCEDWGVDVTYKKNQLVYKDGNLYVCLVTHKATDFDADKAAGYWCEATGSGYTLPKATKTTLGGIKVGNNLEVDTDGVLKSIHETITMGTDTASTAKPKHGETFTAIDTVTKDKNGHVTKVNVKTVTIPDVPTASATDKGGVKVGNGLNINANAVLSIDLADWASGTAYEKNDVVVYGGKLYRCNTAHLSVTSFDSAKFTLIGGGGSGLELWASGTAYKLNDFVVYDNAIYRCNTAHTSTTSFDDAKWDRIGDCLWSYNGNDIIPVGNGHGAEMLSGVEDWGTGVTYLKNQLVLKDSKLYVCAEEHTATTFADDVTAGKWTEVSGSNGALDTMSATTKGGAKLGSCLLMSGDVLSVDTGTTAGKIVKVGTDGKIDSSILPPIAIGNTFVCTSEADMLALTATVGDICVRSDESETYILQNDGASTLANWIKLATPTSGVTSVNSKTGTVTLKASDLENDSKYVKETDTATATKAGLTKLYTDVGENTDGAMTQKAVKDALATKLNSADYKLTDLINDTTASTSTVYSASKVDTMLGDYLPLSGGALTGAVTSGSDNSNLYFASGSNGDGNKGAYVILRGKSVADNGGAFTIASHDGTSEKALIGKADGTLTWDGNSLAIGAIKRLTPTEVTSYADSGGHNSNDTWVKAVFSDMPAGATWLAYNSANEEWSYIFSKSQAGTYGNIQRNSHLGKIQVKGVSPGGVYTKWKEATMTALDY